MEVNLPPVKKKGSDSVQSTFAFKKAGKVDTPQLKTVVDKTNGEEQAGKENITYDNVIEISPSIIENEDSLSLTATIGINSENPTGKTLKTEKEVATEQKMRVYSVNETLKAPSEPANPYAKMLGMNFDPTIDKNGSVSEKTSTSVKSEKQFLESTTMNSAGKNSKNGVFRTMDEYVVDEKSKIPTESKSHIHLENVAENSTDFDSTRDIWDGGSIFTVLPLVRKAYNSAVSSVFKWIQSRISAVGNEHLGPKEPVSEPHVAKPSEYKEESEKNPKVAAVLTRNINPSILEPLDNHYESNLPDSVDTEINSLNGFTAENSANAEVGHSHIKQSITDKIGDDTNSKETENVLISKGNKGEINYAEEVSNLSKLDESDSTIPLKMKTFNEFQEANDSLISTQSDILENADFLLGKSELSERIFTHFEETNLSTEDHLFASQENTVDLLKVESSLHNFGMAGNEKRTTASDVSYTVFARENETKESFEVHGNLNEEVDILEAEFQDKLADIHIIILFDNLDDSSEKVFNPSEIMEDCTKLADISHGFEKDETDTLHVPFVSKKLLNDINTDLLETLDEQKRNEDLIDPTREASSTFGLSVTSDILKNENSSKMSPFAMELSDNVFMDEEKEYRELKLEENYIPNTSELSESVKISSHSADVTINSPQPAENVPSITEVNDQDNVKQFLMTEGINNHLNKGTSKPSDCKEINDLLKDDRENEVTEMRSFVKKKKINEIGKRKIEKLIESSDILIKNLDKSSIVVPETPFEVDFRVKNQEVSKISSELTVDPVIPTSSNLESQLENLTNSTNTNLKELAKKFDTLFSETSRVNEFTKRNYGSFAKTETSIYKSPDSESPSSSGIELAIGSNSSDIISEGKVDDSDPATKYPEFNEADILPMKLEGEADNIETPRDAVSKAINLMSEKKSIEVDNSDGNEHNTPEMENDFPKTFFTEGNNYISEGPKADVSLLKESAAVNAAPQLPDLLSDEDIIHLIPIVGENFDSTIRQIWDKINAPRQKESTELAGDRADDLKDKMIISWDFVASDKAGPTKITKIDEQVGDSKIVSLPIEKASFNVIDDAVQSVMTKYQNAASLEESEVKAGAEIIVSEEVLPEQFVDASEDESDETILQVAEFIQNATSFNEKKLKSLPGKLEFAKKSSHLIIDQSEENSHSDIQKQESSQIAEGKDTVQPISPEFQQSEIFEEQDTKEITKELVNKTTIPSAFIDQIDVKFTKNESQVVPANRSMRMVNEVKDTILLDACKFVSQPSEAYCGETEPTANSIVNKRKFNQKYDFIQNEKNPKLLDGIAQHIEEEKPMVINGTSAIETAEVEHKSVHQFEHKEGNGKWAEVYRNAFGPNVLNDDAISVETVIKSVYNELENFEFPAGEKVSQQVPGESLPEQDLPRGDISGKIFVDQTYTKLNSSELLKSLSSGTEVTKTVSKKNSSISPILSQSAEAEMNISTANSPEVMTTITDKNVAPSDLNETQMPTGFMWNPTSIYQQTRVIRFCRPCNRICCMSGSNHFVTPKHYCGSVLARSDSTSSRDQIIFSYRVKVSVTNPRVYEKKHLKKHARRLKHVPSKRYVRRNTHNQKYQKMIDRETQTTPRSSGNDGSRITDGKRGKRMVQIHRKSSGKVVNALR
ncbi:unnamed protein product [Hymenolepis diminuta]|uniref:Reticulon-like protein n=1 Tax=Hymenolepis diminuta TaxID=6216 RepID=A0A0R3SS30_HYMDI|nr:unnamed protein product [Hymenolepis diminuta]VUZ50217.1 unnamed protein product [Hymenolepis diminuta]